MDIVRALIAVVALLVAGVSCAGDRKSPIPSRSALQGCEVDYAKGNAYWGYLTGPCQYDPDAPQCPSQKDGGTCREGAYFLYKPRQSSTGSGSPGGYSSATYYYCPDSAPVWDGTACLVDDPCKSKAGQSLGRESIWMFLETAPTANSVCVDGCTHQAKSVVCAPKYGTPSSPGDVLQVSTGEACEAQGPFKNMGYKCSSGVPGAGSPYAQPPKPYYDNGKGIAGCAASGGAWGEINGVGTCVKGLTNGTAGKGTGAGVNGTTSKTSTDTKTNADGSTTTTKTTTDTTCKDGVCTSTTTTVSETTTTSGTKTTDTKTGSESKDQNSFCVQNPEHQLCVKNDMTGDCSAGFVCTGDPVQCATAKASQAMKCALDKTNGTTLADQMALGNDPALQGENNPLIPKTVSLSSIAPTRTLSGSCPPPITVSLFGQTASYSFDAICPWIETLGRILVGLAWLTAFFIVSRSIK